MGRNLLRRTLAVSLKTTGNSGRVQSGSLPMVFDCGILRGRNIAVSARFDCDNAVANADGSYHRMGFELCVAFEDGTYQYIGVWSEFGSDSKNVHGRLSRTYTVFDKPMKYVTSSAIYHQNFTADSAMVSEVMLEFGDMASEWSAAPEDFLISKLTDIDFEQGGLETVGVAVGRTYTENKLGETSDFYPIRLRSKELARLLYPGEPYIVPVPEGWKCFSSFYDSSGQLISNVSWKTDSLSTFTPPTAAAYVAFLYAKDDDSNIVPSDLNNIGGGGTH